MFSPFRSGGIPHVACCLGMLWMVRVLWIVRMLWMLLALQMLRMLQTFRMLRILRCSDVCNEHRKRISGCRKFEHGLSPGARTIPIEIRYLFQKPPARLDKRREWERMRENWNNNSFDSESTLIAELILSLSLLSLSKEKKTLTASWQCSNQTSC